jgi:hypothetical protein
MNYILKQSKYLSSEQVVDICNLFERIFEKKMTPNDFKKKFLSNTFKTSYHALLLSDNHKIVGCYTSIPQQYIYYGKEMTFGLSVDTMIDNEYRGNPFTLKKLANIVYDSMKDDGISFVFGFPNDNVYLVRKKILKWKDIGKLKYYILPINIGAIKNKLKYFNFFSKAYAKILNKLVSSELNTAYYNNRSIEKKIGVNYMQSRYDNSYNIEKSGGGFLVYKIYVEDNVRTAFIIDIYPLTKEALEFFTKSIYEKELNNIDVILYAGDLDFSVKNLIEVPSKYEPKTVHMSGKILDSENIDERIFDINNWNVNLSNYDVR